MSVEEIVGEWEASRHLPQRERRRRAHEISVLIEERRVRNVEILRTAEPEHDAEFSQNVEEMKILRALIAEFKDPRG